MNRPFAMFGTDGTPFRNNPHHESSDIYKTATMDNSYWQKQEKTRPLFPDIEWNKPERRDQAGRLGIIGGNRLSFRAVEHSYTVALKTGVGQVRVILPDTLHNTLPTTISDVVFAPSNPSGSLGNDAWSDLQALSRWADGLLLIGDAGRNSQTAIIYEKLISQTATPLVISRDAVDLVLPSVDILAQRSSTIMIVSFSQAQKLLRALYYPKIITFRMPLLQLVEVLHKVTITYPFTLATFHKDTLLAAQDGNVTTTPWPNPVEIWQGSVAARAASYYLWNPNNPLQALTASLLDI